MSLRAYPHTDCGTGGKAYDVILEKPFLECSQGFYREEAASLLNEGNVSSYLKRVYYLLL